MITERLYLDHNATSPLRPIAQAAMIEVLSRPGNPSSVHAEGRLARSLVERAREQVAALIDASARCVTFTSGATEANAQALSPQLDMAGRAVRFDALLVSGVEHPSVRAGGRFASSDIETIEVDREGIVDLVGLKDKLGRHSGVGRRVLLSVQTANNETGVVQPVAKIAQLAHDLGAIVHSDAVQAAGKIPFDIAASGADLISISSHKLGGPQGVGAIVVRDESIRVPPLLSGGGQERGARAGTENVAAIVGFGAAAEEALRAFTSAPGRQVELRNMAETGIRAIAPDVIVIGAGAERLPNTICFSVPGILAETAIIALDLEGVALSAGAACASGKVGSSETLKAMQIDPAIGRGVMRLSIGWDTNKSDISRFLDAWKRVYLNLGQRRRERVA